jgi:hypothetical protein
MAEVWSSDLGAEQKYVLLALADHANDEGEHVYPSVARLVSKTSLSERTVQRRLKDLKTLGLIETVREATNRRPAEYRIRGDRLTPQASLGVSTGHPQGRQADTPRGANVTPEPSVEPSSNRQRASRARASAPTSPAVVAGFIEPTKPKRPDQLMFEAVCEATGIDWTEGVPSSLRGSVNAAVKSLLDCGATPDEVPIRAAVYPLHFGDAALTPSSLAKWWPKLKTAPRKQTRLTRLTAMANGQGGNDGATRRPALP